MAITVYPDRIQFNNYSLSIDDNGLKVSGNGIFSSTVLQTGLGGFGIVSGYTSGGYGPGPAPTTTLNTVDKFPFATNSNASDVGDLTVGRFYLTGQSSSISGYSSGGRSSFSPSVFVNTIDKFPFASNANASDVGDLMAVHAYGVGISSSVSGYVMGGENPGIPISPSTRAIQKFPFATNSNSTPVGILTASKNYLAGQSSTVSGYSSGGTYGGTPTNIIDRFPFVTDGNASDVGDLTQGRYASSGQSSSVSGYTSAGYNPPVGGTNIIDKFPFATNANAADVGDVSIARYWGAGQSSSVSGYTSGGTPTGTSVNIIDKFSFATDANATDVGDLTVGRHTLAGHQY
jgi:hypothetical protein